MKKITICTITAILLMSAYASAQFPIKVPKVKVPKIERTQNEKTNENSNETNERTNPVEKTVPAKTNPANVKVSDRQLVMDDGFTFFNAEPVKGRNPKNTGDVDVGWKLDADLRLMGTFPDNSGFRVVVKKDGREIGKFFCSAWVYRKDSDPYLTSGNKTATHDDFIFTRKCAEPSTPFKTLGWHDVEIYYVDGKTDEEKLVRRHKIDVHKAEQIEGFKGSEYPGVAEYYVQRYAEAPVGIIFAGSGKYSTGSTADRTYDTFDPRSVKPLFIYLPIVPDKRTYYKAYLRCSVNGQALKLPKDGVDLRRTSGNSDFSESALAKRKDPAFSERITFSFLTANLPLAVGEYSLTTNISEHPGKWECRIMENGEVYRIIRFEVGSDGRIVPHAEQQNGNVNLYEKTYLIDVEIPATSSIDERSLPMPEAGLFYGIPWTTAEGKAAAARVPKKGNPYPALPK